MCNSATSFIESAGSSLVFIRSIDVSRWGGGGGWGDVQLRYGLHRVRCKVREHLQTIHGDLKRVNFGGKGIYLFLKQRVDVRQPLHILKMKNSDVEIVNTYSFFYMLFFSVPTINCMRH